MEGVFEMKIERRLLRQGTIEEFADEYGLTMEVHERNLPNNSPDRFYAHFSKSDVLDDCFLVGVFGNGNTEEDAIKNYAEKISMKILVIGAFSVNRKEINVWRLIT